MQRKAQIYGCLTDYDEADQLLLISHKGAHLTAINPEGFMYYNSKDISNPETREVFMHVVKQIKSWDGRELLDPFEVFMYTGLRSLLQWKMATLI